MLLTHFELLFLTLSRLPMNQVTMKHVVAPDFIRNSEDTFIKGIVLIIKKYDKPLQLFRQSNNKTKKFSTEGQYDRMIVVGELDSKDCFVVVCDTAQVSSQLMSDKSLTVGSAVAVLEPVFWGTCLGNDLHNPVFEVTRPFVVINDSAVISRQIPLVLNNTTALQHFCYINRKLLFLQCNVASPTCSGSLCDRRRLKTYTCACIQKNAISAWTLTCRILSKDVDPNSEDPLSGEQLQSFQLAKLFCSPSTLASPSTSVNLTNLREAVKKCQNFVNENGGWFVNGFYKCGTTDESVAQSLNKVRLCRIRPATAIPLGMKYLEKTSVHDGDDSSSASSGCNPPPLKKAPFVKQDFASFW